MWPGDDHTFDIQIMRNPQDKYHAVLVELGGIMGMPRTISQLYATEAEAVEDINKQLAYMVEEKHAFEGSQS